MRRIARVALIHVIISQQQAGALPTRSAADLVNCLIHEIELALASKKTTMLITMDVTGAFDAVLERHLILRMIQKGWPKALVDYITSFPP